MVNPPVTSDGIWKQSDFPDPVGMTVRILRPANSVSTTSSCPGRKLSKPKTSLRTACLGSRAASTGARNVSKDEAM